MSPSMKLLWDQVLEGQNEFRKAIHGLAVSMGITQEHVKITQRNVETIQYDLRQLNDKVKIQNGRVDKAEGAIKKLQPDGGSDFNAIIKQLISTPMFWIALMVICFFLVVGLGAAGALGTVISDAIHTGKDAAKAAGKLP